MADQIKKQVTETGTVTPETGITLESYFCKRYGNVVYLYFATGANMQLSLTTSFTKIATVPQRFRPPSTIIKTCIIYNSSGSSRTEALISVNSLGEISLAALSNGTYGFLRGEFCFVI
jgi:hypothetical protein